MERRHMMSMSKKDYEAIAVCIRSAYNDGPQSVGYARHKAVLDTLTDSIADVMQRDSKTFDRERFLDACTPRWHKEDRGLVVRGSGKGNTVRRASKAVR